MRKLGQFLAVFAIIALLAPSVRWVGVPAGGETCACPPGACMCPMHHHARGQTHDCSMASGGQCGLESHDSYLSSLLSTFIYVPTEHHFYDPLQLWGFRDSNARLNLLPSHVQIPEQPPRIVL
jgi:hypothetical protein